MVSCIFSSSARGGVFVIHKYTKNFMTAVFNPHKLKKKRYKKIVCGALRSAPASYLWKETTCKKCLRGQE